MTADPQKIIIITAPSGAGKTSVTKYLLRKYPGFSFSVSATTRAPRNNEQNGKDYYFISPGEFQRKIKEGEFMEWEMVYEGKYYGTLKSELKRIWNENRIPVLDIDVQGAIHVRQKYPETSFSVFIQPPSLEELKKRLLNRSTETAESLETRLNKSSYEMSFRNQFNKVVVNDDLQRACVETEAAIKEFLGEESEVLQVSPA